MFSKPLIQFSADGRGCVPSLGGQTMVGRMVVMVTSYKGTYSSKRGLPRLWYSVLLTLQQATVNPRLQPTVQETSGYSQASLAQSLWGHCCLLLGPGVHKIFFVPSKIRQIPLAFKVKFSGGSQSLCQIPKLGNLLWVLELLQ